MRNRVEEYLSDTQKYTILLLSANGFEPVRGKLWFQKELFLIAENIRKLEDEAGFEEDLLGPYSEIADAELKQLQIEGIVDPKKLRLTPFGKEIQKQIEPKVGEDVREMVSDMKSFLNDLTEDELLGFIYFSYPEMAIESIKLEQIRKDRRKIAMSLYRKKKVSLGKASSIAGLSQEEFIRELRAGGISVFSE